MAIQLPEGPFEPNWNSLSNYRVPDWYQNDKFGIFIHWGVYSVPAYGSEWYPRNMYQQGSKEFEHHAATYGEHSKFGYKDFIPMFKAEKYDPDHWAELIPQSRRPLCRPRSRTSRWICHVRHRPLGLVREQNGTQTRPDWRTRRGRTQTMADIWIIDTPSRTLVVHGWRDAI